MSFRISWDNENHTRILIAFEGLLTWDVIHAAYGELREMMDSATHRVDWIADLGKSSGVPREDITQNLGMLLRGISPNARMNVVVLEGPNIFISMMLSSFARVAGWSWGFAHRAVGRGSTGVDRTEVPAHMKHDLRRDELFCA